MKKVLFLITLVMMSCASSKESKEERCKKRFSKHSISIEKDSSYLYKTPFTSLRFPKNWKPYLTCEGYWHSPNGKGNKNGYPFTSITKGYYIPEKKIDSIHYYRAIIHGDMQPSETYKPEIKIYDLKGKYGKSYITETKYEFEGEKRRKITQTFYVRRKIYVIVYRTLEKDYKLYYDQAMKIFDSFKILKN